LLPAKKTAAEPSNYQEYQRLFSHRHGQIRRGLSHFLQQGIGHIFSGSKKFTDLRQVITSLKSMIFSFLLGGYIIIYCNDIFFLSAVFFSLNALYVRKK